MDFVTFSHQFAEEVLGTPARKPYFDDIIEVITSISDADLIAEYGKVNEMSLSKAINLLLKERLVKRGWHAESPIFQTDAYSKGRWRLDFAKGKVSIEVAFNHGEAVAWNLLKPVLASQLNHIEKAITTEVGVIICATRALRKAGLFDNTVGDYEKFKTYLRPLQAVLPTPILLIGLEPPKSFEVIGEKIDHKTLGRVQMFENY